MNTVSASEAWIFWVSSLPETIEFGVGVAHQGGDEPSRNLEG